VAAPFTAYAEFYDLLYSRIKDYDAETARIDALLRALHPSAHTVLDVACGTAEHARRLTARGFEVDGLDLDPAFVRLAREKIGATSVFEADMRDFSLPRRYDAVVCLFSAIGYLTTLEDVTQALTRFREHLAPGGVVLVEPWLAPGVLDPTRTAENVGEGDGVRVVRRGRVEVDGRISRLLFDYEITDRAGTRQVSEVHELGLFTTEEMHSAFAGAGLAAKHDASGLGDRGLFIARTAGQ